MSTMISDSLNMYNKHFIKRYGTSGISGQLYEVHLVMWFLLQATHHKIDFFLASNMEVANDVDILYFAIMMTRIT